MMSYKSCFCKSLIAFALEEGKDADVVIVDGCPFDVTGVIKHVLINGEEV